MQQNYVYWYSNKKSTCRSATSDEFVNMREFLSSVHTDVHPLRRTYVYTCVCVCIYMYTHTHTHTSSAVEVRLG
jgi:hypothetical protein